MHFWHTYGRALRDETRLAGAALRDRHLALLLGVFASLLLLAAQAPLSYVVDVGVEDGPGSDLPLVAGFYPRERDLQGTFRWTRDSSQIRLPGVGARPLQLTLRFIAVSPEVAERGPREIELWTNGALAARLPVRPQGAVYRVALAPAASGDYLIELRSATFAPIGDERSIGAGLSAFTASAPAGPSLPAWRSTLTWLAAVVLGWLALRRAGFESTATIALLLPGVLLAALAALLDQPRFAFGATPALIALGLGWGLAVALSVAQRGLTTLLGRLGILVLPNHWRWLTLMAVLVLATRYGGKIYPDSMPGDIGFHINRFADVARGTLLIVSRNRGVDFPYPPALYLLLMPLSLAGVERRVALQFGGALLDALSLFLVYVIAAALTRPARRREGAGARPAASFSVPLVAAAIYSFSAAGFMTTWWNFSTHIFAQFAHLLLIAALVLLAPLLVDRRRTKDQGRRTKDEGPRTKDQGPQTEDRRPTSNDQRLTTSDRRRTTTDRRPTTTDRRPTTNDQRPTSNDQRPTTSDRRPTSNDQRPAARSQQPATSVLRPWSVVCVLVLLQCLVYLGHFGFWMNMSLLGAFGLAVLFIRRLRPVTQHTEIPSSRRMQYASTLLVAFVVAQGLAALLFYTGYTGMLLAQAQAAATGGLTGLAGRPPQDRELLWQILWDYGLRIHFGFFPLPLALCGGLLLALRLRQQLQEQPPATSEHAQHPPAEASLTAEAHDSSLDDRRWGVIRRVTALVLMAGTLLIALFFAALPFLSGSTLSSRWLMFSAWVIALGGAFGAAWLWRRGQAGRLVVMVTGCYVLWITASMWLMALAWRIRPPEPF